MYQVWETSRNKLEKKSVSKIVLTFHYEKKIVLVISKIKFIITKTIFLPAGQNNLLHIPRLRLGPFVSKNYETFCLQIQQNLIRKSARMAKN